METSYFKFTPLSGFSVKSIEPANSYSSLIDDPLEKGYLTHGCLCELQHFSAELRASVRCLKTSLKGVLFELPVYIMACS